MYKITTTEEALEWCNSFEENVALSQIDAGKRRYYALQAIHLCKIALRKQIENLPIFIWHEDGSADEVCSKCFNKLDGEPKYCPECGQALKRKL